MLEGEDWLTVREPVLDVLGAIEKACLVKRAARYRGRRNAG
jgi:hypothetical protein